MWKPMKDFSGYSVSDSGEIKNDSTGNIRKLRDNKGYLAFRYDYQGRRCEKAVHRIVYETFVGPIPDGYVIDHIDHNRQNNSVDNLQAMTARENSAKQLNKLKGLPNGVTVCGSKYVPSACLNGKVYRLGVYDTPEEAKEVYDDAVAEYDKVVSPLVERIVSKYRGKKCVICGEEFTPHSMKANCCSKACSAEFYRRNESKRKLLAKKDYTGECVYCGNTFTYHRKKKYCSSECSYKANKENAKRRKGY